MKPPIKLLPEPKPDCMRRGPQHGDDRHHGEALHHRGQHVLLAHQAAVKERQAGPVIINTSAELTSIQALSAELLASATCCCSCAIRSAVLAAGPACAASEAPNKKRTRSAKNFRVSRMKDSVLRKLASGPAQIGRKTVSAKHSPTSCLGERREMKVPGPVRDASY